MARKKKESTPGEKLAKQIIEQYNPKSVEDMQNALKDIFGPMFEAMLQGEMNGHLGYESNDHGSKSTANRRNGYISKKIKTSAGEVDIKVPRDRDASFEPKLVPKRKKDVSEIEAKVLAMYARGMSQRDIAETIEDIYGFEISHETISEITDCVLDELNDWQNRPLKKMYTFLFVDCMYVTIRKEYESKSYAVYTIDDIIPCIRIVFIITVGSIYIGGFCDFFLKKPLIYKVLRIIFNDSCSVSNKKIDLQSGFSFLEAYII